MSTMTETHSPDNQQGAGPPDPRFFTALEAILNQVPENRREGVLNQLYNSCVSDEAAAREDDVHLVYAGVHYWRGNYKVRNSTTEANGVRLTPLQISTPHWKLMPTHHKVRLQQFEKDVRKTCRDHDAPCQTRASLDPAELHEMQRRQLQWVETGQGTLPRHPPQDDVGHVAADHDRPERFYLKGCFLIPDSKVEAFVEEMEQHNSDLREYVREELCSDVDSLRQQIREQLADDAAYEIAIRHIPSSREMLAQACVDWTPIPISLGENRFARDINASELRRHFNERRDGFVTGALESIFREPREALIEAFDALTALLARDGQVTTRSMQPIRREIQKFRSFSGLDSTMDAQLAELERVAYDPGVLAQMRAARNNDNDSVMAAAERTGLASRIREVSEHLTESVESFNTHGRFTRGIRFGGASANEQEE